jgi:hypothetical protein
VASRRVLPRLLATAIFFCALEGLIFHTRLYPSYIEPDSTTGTVEYSLRNELKRPKPDRNQVLAVGHSRMSLLPRIANEMTSETGYTFASIGVGGTSPRDWYYELRGVDPSAHTYAAIVVPSDDYNEPDEYDDLGEHEWDINYILARLQVSDLIEFPWSYRDWKKRWLAVHSILLKGYVYKRDLSEFLLQPEKRLEKIALYERGSAGWVYSYGGEKRSVAGIDIDYQHKQVRYPNSISQDMRELIERILFRPMPPDKGIRISYFRYWYGRIVDRYKGTGTKVVFVRVPRAPVTPPNSPYKPNSAVRQMASHPDVVMLDEQLYNPLEKPELFMDPLHLDREGMILFSRILATETRRVLGPPKP